MSSKPTCIHIVDINENRTCKASAGNDSDYCVLHDPKTKKCQGKTKDGTDCRSLPTKNGNGYCHNHIKGARNADKIRCSAMTKKNTRCTISVAEEGQNCKVHGGPGKISSKKKIDDKKLLDILGVINEVFDADIKEVTVNNFDILKAHLRIAGRTQKKEIEKMKIEYDGKMVVLLRLINTAFDGNIEEEENITADSYDTFRRRLVEENNLKKMEEEDKMKDDKGDEGSDAKLQF
uniref:Uncharacterized protein n=1 Tax=Pithovirus LCPAC406 TaxID=2506599 RepID=A0A481ZFX6_9VIRU|nr:MAG: uncharacterized protein LCPAC406_01240 [Pithovirus LCPAC406]